MEKDKKNLLIYLLLFLIICYTDYIFLLLATVGMTVLPACRENNFLCFGWGVFFILITKIFQIIVWLLMGIKICKTNNKYLKNIRESWKFPLGVLGIFLVVDVVIIFTCSLIDSYKKDVSSSGLLLYVINNSLAVNAFLLFGIVKVISLINSLIAKRSEVSD